MNVDPSQFEAILTLFVGGVPVAVGVFLTVQALRFADFINDGVWARRVVLLSALGYSGVWLAIQLEGTVEFTIASVAGLIINALWGAFFAALAYRGWDELAKPGLARLWKRGE